MKEIVSAIISQVSEDEFAHLTVLSDSELTKVRGDCKATRIAEWLSGSERKDPPRWALASHSLALPISAMTPTLLTAPTR